MSRLERALVRVLRDPEAFSRYVLGRPLRPYQMEPYRAILDAVLNRQASRDGRLSARAQAGPYNISVMMSRQGGKNELSAHLECYLLNLFRRAGGNIVKCAPTFKPQVLISKMRLEQLLQNPWHAGRWKGEWGYSVRLGAARVLFFSADEQANVVGATAHHLLEFDEAQDIAVEKHDRDFAPMGAATNCPRVYYGTAWDETNLLARVKQAHLEAQAQDGLRRHFEYPWWVVAEHNPLYGAYVEGEAARLGENHPLFRTQYKLETIAGAGGFFSPSQLAQMVGDHPRRHRREEGKAYVAGMDVAGEEEAGLPDAQVRALQPRRDSTVVTIAEVDYTLIADLVREPRLKVVEHYWWTGRGHRQQYEQLLDLLREVWGCQRVAVDATGLGAGVASFLRQALGESRCEAFQFTAQSKSRLGYGLWAAVNGGRFKMYREEGRGLREEGEGLNGWAQYGAYSPEAVEFWRQCQASKYELREDQTLNFFVPEGEGHDDFLLSAALCVEAAGGLRPAPAGGIVPSPLEYGDGRY